MRQLTIVQSITNRSSPSLDKYLQDISKEEMVTAEEETKLALAIRSGDKQALDTLTKANLRFVVSVAKQYQHRGLSLPDLINEGNLGLIKAAMRFDETKGFKFISYAVWWIRQGIIQALCEQGRMVRLPSNRVSLGHKVQKTFSQLEQEYERAPSIEEMKSAMSLTEEELLSVSDYHINYISLDSPHPETGEENRIESLVDNKTGGEDTGMAYLPSLKIEIKRCLSGLTEKERDIISNYFGLGLSEALSLNEIAAKYDMTGERVRQIKDKVIKSLRNGKRTALLREYLGK